MGKNVKIALGCFGTAILGVGVIIGMVIEEKIDDHYTKPTIDIYRKLAEDFGELLKKEYEKNDILQKEVLRMKREEASEK